MKWFFIFLFFFYFNSFSQNGYVFYRDQLKGGVSCDGYSPNAGQAGNGIIKSNIFPNSSIKRAFLFAGRQGNANPLSIIFDNKIFIFDSTNQITNSFNSIYGGLSAIHVIDVTKYIYPFSYNYQINIPQQSNNSNDRYTDFYLYIEYENNLLSEITTTIYLNELDFNKNIRSFNISPLNKIDITKDASISFFTGYLCDTIEGENIYINNNFLGLIGLPDINSGNYCGGTKGSFYYENYNLYGLQDDIANYTVNGSDAISIINPFINNNDTIINVRFESKIPNNFSNAIWAIFLTYSSNCVFNTSITPGDTICFGDSIQLQATGGVQYSWFGAFGGLSDTAIANPVASPPQTTTYICTIKNDSGCVKTEHVKVWVIQPPNSFTVKNSICGYSTGSITVNNMPSGYTYALYNNAFLVDSNISGVFNNLPGGVYLLKSYFPSKGCVFYDTLSIQDSIIVQASFWRNPTTGKAPLTVQFGNQSQNATNYLWYFPTDTLTTVSPTYTFEQGGTYTVYLIAYNNLPHCADTASYTFYIEGDISISIPNVFTPNGDGINDAFALAITGANEIEQLSVSIFNRWGQQLAQRTFGAEVFTSSQVITDLTIWDGHTNAGDKAPEGTYFYTIKYKDINGAEQLLKGSFSLLR